MDSGGTERLQSGDERLTGVIEILVHRLQSFGRDRLHTDKGTAAVTRVLIDSTNGDLSWSTIGVSENIIEASWTALFDSIVFGLLHTANQQD